MPDDVVPWGKKYLAGWGYVLSRDVAAHVVRRTLRWERMPDEAPAWYPGLHWEDVLVGFVAGEVVEDIVVSLLHSALLGLRDWRPEEVLVHV